MALGGIIVTSMIVAADKGLAAADRADWTFIIVFGALIGCAAAWGWLRGTAPKES
jgi:di/tricarboxylate transporter